MSEKTTIEWTVRNATQEDVDDVVELIRAVEADEQNQIETTREELEDWWKFFNLEEDTWVAVVQGPDGGEQVVGYMELLDRRDHCRLNADGYVHPEYLGLGIGTALLEKMEARAREHIPLASEGKRVYIQNGIVADSRAAMELLEGQGYTPARYFLRMEIELDQPLNAPQMPEGVRLQTYDEPPIRQVFEAMEDGFRDHWEWSPWNYEEWSDKITGAGYNPTLWFLALDENQEDEIAGGALCRMREEVGWVQQLAVRKPWRGQGLGFALLLAAFGAFYRRGVKKVGLTVDAQNPTGATRLYKRAGMQVVEQYAAYEKELRPGT